MDRFPTDDALHVEETRILARRQGCWRRDSFPDGSRLFLKEEFLMKKSLVFAMAMALGVSATAFAANPFSDVPAGHWAYRPYGATATATAAN